MLAFGARRLVGSNFTRILPQLKDITRQMSGRLVFNEIKGDLLAAPSKFSLAHSVGADFNMSSGLAAKFNQVFGQIGELKSQKAKKGGVAVLKDDERFIYYLVTKERSQDKPTYATVKSSLTAMKGHMFKHKVRFLAMPRIGCGSDGLEWEKVKFEITRVFGKIDVCITIYY